jgi:hypothetical protein
MSAGRASSSLRVTIVASSSYVALQVLILVACIVASGEHFSYVLDDPYIHLALAENLQYGHYGINLGEPSAPSSSIAYPWLLVPGFWLGVPEAWPWLLNLLPLTLVVALFASRAHAIWPLQPMRALFATLAVVYATALVSLPVTGMEHGLHVAFTCLGLEGLARARERRAPGWLPLVIAGCVAMRFEGLAMALLAIAALLLWREWLLATVAGALVAVVLLGHVLYVGSLGLPLMPSSVLTKSRLAADVDAGQSLYRSLRHLAWEALQNLRYAYVGPALLLAALTLLWLGWRSWRRGPVSGERRWEPLWLSAAAVALSHLAAGSMGWFNRYEAYALATAMLALLIAAGSANGEPARRRLPWVLAVIVGLCGSRYTRDYLRITSGSHNIAEQQYVMHRFAAEFYGAQVAVNDIGWVSYRNPNDELDLFGLGSEEARKAIRDAEPGYIARLTAEHRVGVAMIYRSWFDQRIPGDWVRLGELRLTSPRVTAGDSVVTFFMTPAADRQRVRSAIARLQAEYPEQFVSAPDG